MTWIGLSDHDSHHFRQGGLTPHRAPQNDPPAHANLLMPRGSIVIETRITPGKRPQPLLQFDRYGDWQMHLSLQSIPGGGITLVLNQGGAIAHCAIQLPQAGRLDILRVTYSWDAPAKWGQLALEQTGNVQFHLAPIQSPKPIRVLDAQALIAGGPDRYVSPDVLYLAVSDQIEPVGPMPTLTPGTPVATPGGYVPVGQLRRGDTVLTNEGRAVPVLHSLSRTVPARGHFAPVQMRAPYFGLQENIIVAPSLQLVITGSVVDYMFATEAVLVNACHLVGGTAARPVQAGPVVTYCQVLLPGHEALMAAGTAVDSLYIGRLRRKKRQMAASLLAGLDRNRLPEHGMSAYPVLQPFDALVLAEQRAA